MKLTSRLTRTLIVLLVIASLLGTPGPILETVVAQEFAREAFRSHPTASPLKELPSLKLTLHRCYELALKQSEIVALRREGIEETEAEFLKAASEIIGDADFVITQFRQDAPESGTSGGSSVGGTLTAHNRRERKFVFSQPLFQGFKSIAALGGASSLRNQRKHEWRRAEQLLLLDVVRSFYNVLEQKKNIEIVEAIHLAMAQRAQELAKREKIGRSRLSELATTVSQVKLLEAELARARGQWAVASDILEFLVGLPVETARLTDQPLPKEGALVLEEHLRSYEARPDVEASKQAVKTTRQGVIEAQSNFWPVLSLDSNLYEKREGFQKDIKWDVLFKISIPLSRGGENLGKFKEALSQWRKSKLIYERAKREAHLQIKEAYHYWMAARVEFNALKKAVRAAQKNVYLQERDYARNLVSNLDVLEALKALYETRREANRIFYDMKERFWQFQVAKGSLDDLI